MSQNRSIWERQRLQQFAGREGLSLTLVQNLQAKDSRASFDQDVDRVVDPEFQLINAPRNDA